MMNIVCFLLVFCGFYNSSIVVNATESEETIDVQAAVIGIESFSIEEGSLEAGTDVTININVYNMNSKVSASNIVLTMTNDSGTIYPAYGSSNQFFIGDIAGGGSKSISIPFSLSSDFSANVFWLQCQFDYTSAYHTYSNTANVVIPVATNSLTNQSVEVSAHATVNGKSLLSVSMTNNSAADVTDARLVIDGNVSEDSKNIQLDTIAAGKTYSKDCQIVFTETGDQAITISVIYTNIYGEEIEKDLGSYTVKVDDEKLTVNDESDTNTIFAVAGKLIAVIALFGVLIATFSYIKNR